MNITRTTMAEVPDVLGLVFIAAACDNDAQIQEWISGATTMLREAGAINDPTLLDEDIWSDLLITTSTGGRTDIVFVISEPGTFNIGKLAMFRLHFPECSWIDDWKRNYRHHHDTATTKVADEEEDDDN